MERHSTYYLVLEAIQTAKGCAFCKLEADAAHSYFDAILYEAVNDPKVRSELLRSKGYCHRHAHLLTEMGDNFGVAILYQDQIKKVQELLAKKVLNELNPTVERDNNNIICPACRNQIETRRRYLSIAMEELGKAEMKTAFERSPGFCIPHLTMLLEKIKVPDIRNYLTEIEARNLNGLYDELQEFIRKHDYRFSNEPYGEERDSWHRVIKKLTGSRFVF